jgi:hypothetical protein
MQAQSVNPTGSSEVQELHIRVLEADQIPVEPGKFSQQALTVVVTDSQGAAVSSAAVLFRLPSEGATGVFGDGSRVTVLYTDADGRATVKGINWSTTPGTAAIRVTASKGTAHAGLLVEQIVGPSKSVTASAPPAAAAPHAAIGQPADPNPKQQERPILISSTGAAAGEPVPPPSVQITSTRPESGANGRSKKWLWIGLGAAAAAGMAFAFVGKNGSTPAATPATPAGTTIGTPSISIGHP